MDFIKKNLNIIIPAVIALVGVGLLVPTMMVRSSISEELSESVQMGREVDSAVRSVVPSRQFEVVKSYQDAHEEDANSIVAAGINTTKRSLLSYKIFPDPNETSTQIFNEFCDAFKKTFNSFIKDMSALDAPTDIEIQQEAGTDVVSVSTRRDSRYGRDTDGQDEKIIELVCKRRSEEISVYANPAAFGGYGFWDNWEYRGKSQAVTDCWYSQLACWINKDVVDTIVSLNKGSGNVADSAVKRLLGVRFDNENANVAGLEENIAMPFYTTESTPGLIEDWTGRKTDGKIDVLQFSLAVIIRSDEVLKFMEELCSEKTHTFSGFKGDSQQKTFKHNQITILKSNIDPVDLKSPEHYKYRYGDNAVVKLNLICEYIFNRKGYDSILPESVKKQIRPASAPTTFGGRRRY